MNYLNEFILFTLYFIGCFLCYGRLYAAFYEINEEFGNDGPVLFYSKFSSFMALWFIFTSWIGFFSMVITYFTQKEKYFFRLYKNK